MSVPLFDSAEQQGGLSEYESTFEFLQRGGRPEAVAIRQWMERAFRCVAADRQHQLRQRLRDSAFPGFKSAYFELQIHEMLRRLQCSFDYQPEEPGSYPADFRVIQGDNCCGIEVTTFVQDLRLNESDFVELVRRNKELVEKLRRRGLSLNLRVNGELVGEVPKQARSQFINQLCRAAEAPSGPMRSSWDPPNAHILCGEWRCEGRLWTSGGSGGYINPPARFDDKPISPQSIRKKLQSKQRRWRKYWDNQELAPGPFLLAMSVDFVVSSSTVEAALYGAPGSSQYREPFVQELHRTNAVIVFHNAALGSEKGASVRLYRNGQKTITNHLKILTEQQPLPKMIGI